MLKRFEVEHRMSVSLSRQPGFMFLCSLVQELHQKEQQWRRRCEELQLQVQQLQEDRDELHHRLKGSHAQEGTINSILKCKGFTLLVTGLSGSLHIT